jgi:hypothetical protein
MWLIEQNHSPTSLKLNRPKTTKNKKSKTRNLQEKRFNVCSEVFHPQCSRLQSVFSFYPVSEGLNTEKQEFAHEMAIACPRDNVSGLDGSGGAGICR